jgi:serine-aspartate repeat-containing protein C/D/E
MRMLSLCCVWVWTACTSAPDVVEDIEGDVSGECTDAADNDADGYYDCEDSDCYGSPDCAETDTDTDTDSDTDTDTDTDTDSDTDTDTDSDTDSDTDADADTDLGAHLATIAVTYDLSFDFDEFCPFLTDCTQTYLGSGTQVDATGDTVTFGGAWELSTSDCDPTLDAAAPDGALWWPSDGVAFHSIQFDGVLESVDTWVAHRDQADSEPLTGSAMANEQFYIYDMFAEYSDAKMHFHHEETGIGLIDLCTVTNLHVLDVTFTE